MRYISRQGYGGDRWAADICSFDHMGLVRRGLVCYGHPPFAPRLPLSPHFLNRQPTDAGSELLVFVPRGEADAPAAAAIGSVVIGPAAQGVLFDDIGGEVQAGSDASDGEDDWGRGGDGSGADGW